LVSGEIESLERRLVLVGHHNANGFTVYTPSPGDTVIYVSSSEGKDSYAGTSMSAPVLTVRTRAVAGCL